MKRLTPRRSGFLLALLLAFGSIALAPTPANRPPARNPFLRLLGPAAGLASDLQWVRYRAARDAGSEARAISLARSAIDLEPTRTDGWRVLAAHLALDLASPEHEAERTRRAGWFEAGIELTRTGERWADDPGELALWRGLLYLSRLEVDPDLLDGGRAELTRRAEEAFAEAARLGSAEALALIERGR
ncbi:MAG TPA: hypothetical protein ENJ09_13490 [Planctomycetes bacterium]|nr:hypothetical protein [Planctomycetota bacterium]